MIEITQQAVRDVLDYSPSAGTLTWRVARGRCAAGSPAGYEADRGYRAIRIFGKVMYIHRVAFLYMAGSMPPEVDHINGSRSDNRWANLRAADRLENSKNMKTPNTNKSGVIGVFWNRGKRKWTARIKVRQQDIHLGHFERLSDAAEARRVAELEHGFHKNHGRIGYKRGVLLEFPTEATC